MVYVFTRVFLLSYVTTGHELESEAVLCKGKD